MTISPITAHAPGNGPPRIDVHRHDTFTLVYVNGQLVAKRIESTGHIEWSIRPSVTDALPETQMRVEAALAQVPRNMHPNRHERRRKAKLKKARR